MHLDAQQADADQESAQIFVHRHGPARHRIEDHQPPGVHEHVARREVAVPEDKGQPVGQHGSGELGSAHSQSAQRMLTHARTQEPVVGVELLHHVISSVLTWWGHAGGSRVLEGPQPLTGQPARTRRVGRSDRSIRRENRLASRSTRRSVGARTKSISSVVSPSRWSSGRTTPNELRAAPNTSSIVRSPPNSRVVSSTAVTASDRRRGRVDVRTRSAPSRRTLASTAGSGAPSSRAVRSRQRERSLRTRTSTCPGAARSGNQVFACC